MAIYKSKESQSAECLKKISSLYFLTNKPMSYREALRIVRKERKECKKLSPEWRSTITKEKALKLAKPTTVKSKKPKKKTRGQIVKQLDEVFSKYIRVKYADKFGNVECYTCGKVLRWDEMQNGHFITRGCYSQRWSELNCRPQCVGCNVFLNGNYIEYTRRMIDELGRDTVDRLVAQKQVVQKIDTTKIQEFTEYYNDKLYEESQKLV